MPRAPRSIESRRKVSAAILARRAAMTPEQLLAAREAQAARNRKNVQLREIRKSQLPKPPRNVKYGWKRKNKELS